MKPLHILLLLLLTAMLVGVTAYLIRQRDGSLTHLQAAGQIRIGYAIEPPYAFLDDKGEVTGEAPEIARHMAARLGISRVAWRQMEFSELIDALLADRIDVIATGMFVTPERQQRVLFSDPTLAVGPALLVMKGNPTGIVSYQQAAKGDVRFAVLAGAVEAQILRQLGVPPSRLREVPDALAGRQVIESGLADALMLSEPTVRWMVQREQLGRTESVLAGTSAGDAYGRPAFVFRSDARQLLIAWNDALASYLGSPEHLALLSRLGLQGMALKKLAP